MNLKKQNIQALLSWESLIYGTLVQTVVTLILSEFSCNRQSHFNRHQDCVGRGHNPRSPCLHVGRFSPQQHCWLLTSPHTWPSLVSLTHAYLQRTCTCVCFLPGGTGPTWWRCAELASVLGPRVAQVPPPHMPQTASCVLQSAFLVLKVVFWSPCNWLMSLLLNWVRI